MCESLRTDDDSLEEGVSDVKKWMTDEKELFDSLCRQDRRRPEALFC